MGASKGKAKAGTSIRAYHIVIPPQLQIPSCWDEAVGYMERIAGTRGVRVLADAKPLLSDRGPGPVRRVNRWAREASAYLEARWNPAACGPDTLRDLQRRLTVWADFHFGHPGTIEAIRKQGLPALRAYIAATEADYLPDEDGLPLVENFNVRTAPDETIITFRHPIHGRIQRTTDRWQVRYFFMAAKRYHWTVTGKQLKDFMGRMRGGERESVNSWEREFERAGLLDVWDMLIFKKGQRYRLRLRPDS